jgi:uncharacterized protein YndB with AHSA1/START domain
MSQTVNLEVFYPYPPERVWQMLTDRRALTAWMMENNFEPKLGHKFQFYSHPLPGLTTTIHCEVVELEEPSRLVYTWKESLTAEPSLVIWTLTSVEGGTEVRLKHHQYSYMTAATASYRPGSIAPAGSSFNREIKQFSSRMSVNVGLKTTSGLSLQRRKQLNLTGSDIVPGISEFQTFSWNYFLYQKLPQLLTQSQPVHC